ncbi:MAG TPA: hypothetical protein VLE73_04035 [Candidatus Saccharimonadales bacterium]|nr:hypothetical protein [Candidatus Saccharimonadales bacterium]
MSEQPAAVSGIEANFAYYRECFENPSRQQGAEAEGLFDSSDFRLAYEDPRTTMLDIPTDDSLRTVPLLAPLRNYGDANLDFYNRYAGSRPLMYYNHLSTPFQQSPQAYIAALRPALRQLAAQNGVIVFNHTDLEAHTVNAELTAITDASGLRLTDIHGPEGAATKHYHYASIATPIEKTDVPSTPVSLYSAYAQLPDVLQDANVTVSATLPIKDIEQVWGFYEQAFAELTANDPVQAGFSEKDFKNLMQDPSFVKFVYREGNTIGNINIQTDVRNLPWMNQYYYRTTFPQYEQGLVFCSPGVITNPELRSPSMTIRSASMLGKLIVRSGAESIITFACDTESNKQVPGLARIGLKKGGLQTNFSKPVSHQLFRMASIAAKS